MSIQRMKTTQTRTVFEIYFYGCKSFFTCYWRKISWAIIVIYALTKFMGTVLRMLILLFAQMDISKMDIFKR